MAEATIQNRLNFFDRFMTFRFGAKLGNLNAITPDNLVAFLRKVLFRRGRFETRRRRRICVPCSASCSGSARPNMIWQPAFRVSPDPGILTCPGR